MRTSILIACVTFALGVPVARADKVSEASEKPWSRISASEAGGSVLADVTESEPANDTCPGDAYTPGDLYHAQIDPFTDVDWIHFSCNAWDNLVAVTEQDGSLPPVDTILSLYESDCATLIATDDDSGPGLFSLIDILAPYTGTYSLKVESFGNSSGSYRALVTCGPPPSPPANNTCAGAVVVDSCSISFTDSGTTTAAGNDYDPQGMLGCACDASGSFCFSEAGRDVVYVLEIAAGNLVEVIFTNHDADGSVYLVADCADVPGSCVAGADATLTGQAESFVYSPSVTGTYYLICDSFGTNTGGAYDLAVALHCPVSVESRSWGRVKALYR